MCSWKNASWIEDVIKVITEFPCLSGHPVKSRSYVILTEEYSLLYHMYGCPTGCWILATSPCVLAWVYSWDRLLIGDVKRLWLIHTVQISNKQYAFGVQMYEEVLYLEFYSVFSEPFINDEILLWNSCENGILHTIKE